MPTYILLSTLTVQGVQTLKSNPERLRAVNQDVEELGCKVLHQWATLGEFDFVNVVEAPVAGETEPSVPGITDQPAPSGSRPWLWLALCGSRRGR